MPETNHTPTPWQQAGLWNAEVFGTRADADLIALCSVNDRRPVDERRANAAFIVRAVNAHEAYTALEQVVRDLLELLPLEPYHLDAYVGATFRPKAREALAALKLARGEA